MAQGHRQGGSQDGSLLDDGAGRADLDQDGGHPRLPQEGHRHAQHTCVVDPERDRHRPLDQLGQTTAAGGLVVGARPERRAAQGGRRVQTQADEHVDGQLVGLLGLHAGVGVMELADACPGQGQPPPQRPGDAAESAALTHCHVPAAQGGRGITKGGPFSHRRHRTRVVLAALEAQEFAQRRAADDTVDRQPGVALELAERPARSVPEDAVDPRRIEPEGAQALLELGDVVTPQHRGPAVQEAVAEPETRLYERVPRLRAAHPVDAETAQALEGLDGGPGGGAEDTVGIDGRAREDGGEAVLDVGDRWAAVADGERQAYR